MAAHTYWRMNVAAVDGGTVVGVAEVVNRTSVGGSAIAPQNSAPSVTATSRTVNLLGAASLTLVQNGNADEGAIDVALPFAIPFFGGSYTHVFPNANSYLTFGVGTPYTYSGLSASNPAYPAIHINSADRSFQRLYSGAENGGDTWRIRYEGSVGTSGTVGSSTIFWEMTFSRLTPNVILIDIGSNAASGAGTSLIGDGATSQATFGAGTNSIGYTLTSMPATLPTASTQQTGNEASKAFDVSNVSNWLSASGQTAGWLAWQFTTAQDIVEHVVTAPATTMTNAPKNWTLQWSDDGVSWNTVAIVNGQTDWTANEQRVFTHSNWPLAIGHNIAPVRAVCTVTPPAPSVNALLPTRPALQTSSMITGTVKQSGTPCARVVRAYRRLDGSLIGEALSDATSGAFSINARGVVDRCYVVALDDLTQTPDFNALIYDLVIPV